MADNDVCVCAQTHVCRGGQLCVSHVHTDI